MTNASENTARTQPQGALPEDELLPGGTMHLDGTPRELHATARRLYPRERLPIPDTALRWTRLPEHVPADPRLERTRAVWVHHGIAGTRAERDGWYLLTSAEADYGEPHLRDCEPAIRTGPLDCDPEELHRCLVLCALAGAPIANACDEDGIAERADKVMRDALAERVRETARFLTQHGKDLRTANLDERLYLLQRACDERRAWLDG